MRGLIVDSVFFSIHFYLYWISTLITGGASKMIGCTTATLRLRCTYSQGPMSKHIRDFYRPEAPKYRLHLVAAAEEHSSFCCNSSMFGLGFLPSPCIGRVTRPKMLLIHPKPDCSAYEPPPEQQPQGASFSLRRNRLSATHPIWLLPERATN